MNKKVLIVGAIVIGIAGVWMFYPRGTKTLPQAESASSAAVKELYQKANDYKRGRNLVKAKEAYQEILINHPDADNVAAIQRELEDVNMTLLLSNAEVPGKTVVHQVVSGDTLGKIAKKYNTTVDLIKKSNNLKSDVIRLGQKLRIWNGTFSVYVDKSQNILILRDGTDVVKVYRVSTGENNSTPVGQFKITSKLPNPVWFNKGIVVPPESPENVLGTRWMGFDLPGYGIHGTVEPDAIGQQVTAGCVRMRNEEAEELYSIVPEGTKVTIVD
ncbi:MAG: L,D-transpeptidase family protein [Candidatus Omnitrophica bacterium]|nr:L,D-transpeptidase family protein [Candidatus Omnitrophota bacterium]